MASVLRTLPSLALAFLDLCLICFEPRELLIILGGESYTGLSQLRISALMHFSLACFGFSYLKVVRPRELFICLKVGVLSQVRAH